MSLKTHKNLSKSQIIDAGMAVVLILLFVGLAKSSEQPAFSSEHLILKLAFLALLINMIVPKFYYLFGVCWFAFAEFMGSIMSKVILLIIFLTVVFPVGFLRQLIGKDSLRLKKFKKGTESVLTDRNLTYTAEDLDHPY